ncbi:FecCD family ABC transporter permease [Paenibacillus xerothermodurans]|uniref:Iron ABC transporter permease n=1 Tax=Paenibacillus xerothermodurans TaxID=1977292 RepID=A0A2W1NYA1_PAEXE|nr:iron ABC transporter permease [Paenibacillus xerothermodurans]PZE19858.1 iron ABC transporter permease [Paenibacillus xerothermodurans]
MSQYITLRGKGYSVLLSKKTLLISLVLFLLCFAASVISASIGTIRIPLLDVVKVLLGVGDPSVEMIVMKLRLPRIVIGMLVGASLAVAGAILQGMIRNPLTSPDVVGITEGASLGAVCFFFFLSETVSIHMLPLFTITGAFLGTAVIYLLAWKHGVSPLRLVLIGIGTSAVFKSLSYMLMISTPNFFIGAKSLTFMTGSIYGTSWDKDVAILLPWVAFLLPLTCIQARNINVQQLGDEVTASVGGSVQVQRFILILLSIALAGAAVSVGGAISFIGLIAPHIARKLVGPAFGGVLPVSALIGSLILVLADLIARTILPPLDLPAGIFTAAVGAPFFIYLLYRQRHT